MELEDITWLLLDLLHGLEVDRPGKVVDLLDGLAHLGGDRWDIHREMKVIMKHILKNKCLASLSSSRSLVFGGWVIKPLGKSDLYNCLRASVDTRP